MRTYDAAAVRAPSREREKPTGTPSRNARGPGATDESRPDAPSRCLRNRSRRADADEVMNGHTDDQRKHNSEGDPELTVSRCGGHPPAARNSMLIAVGAMPVRHAPTAPANANCLPRYPPA